MFLFESKRLGFRSFKTSDEDSFIELGQDSEVMKFYPYLLSVEESLEKMSKINSEINNLGYGFWAVELKETGEFIGTLGISDIKFESFFTPALEIGWRFHKNFWRQGLAKEGALRVFDFMKEKNISNKIVAFTANINLPSQMVMKSIGMSYLGDFIHPDIGDLSHPLAPHVVYKKDL